MKRFNIYDGLEYGEDRVKITPMFESEASKEIRITLKKDQVMKDHKTSFPINIEIFEGSIDFGVEGEIFNLVKGDIISLDANVVHNLKGNENSIVRLSLSKNDTVNRVKDVLKL
ncbi:MAG: cupin [Candidatus Cloacimonadota bacterium]|nr:MAG: cupin [Candidatus Cloacimonadota bacterium]PIE77803.1 MAG: cupin [Candidatus Delongbacteria bacterium]